jgi:RNA polymerase sigma factor (TIGR02999 family)
MDGVLTSSTIKGTQVLTEEDSNVTRLLLAWSNGDPQALDRLMPLVHAELHRIARRCMAGERPGHTLQPSALVNEAFVRLSGGQPVDWKSRKHFSRVFAQVMRRVLIDHARARDAQKRIGSRAQPARTASGPATPAVDLDLLGLDQALRQLEQLDPRKGRVVELRVFGGLTLDEAAEAMDVALITVRRDWTLALAWLRDRLEVRRDS